MPYDQETVSAGIDSLVRTRGMSYDEANAHYAKFYEKALEREDSATRKGQEPIRYVEGAPNEHRVPMLSMSEANGLPDNSAHMGSINQLRFGKMVGDSLGGLDPVFGALLSPTGGIPGAGNVRVTNAFGLGAAGGLDVVTNHGIAHDAAGYLLNYHQMGPGYTYVPGASDALSNTNPLAGQTTGLSFYSNLKLYGTPTAPVRGGEIGFNGVQADTFAMNRADVERQVQLEILGGQAREDSVQGAQLFQTGGPARNGGLRGASTIEMVRNGNWDAALNIGADPYGVLPDLAGLKQDMAQMNRMQAEGQINDLRQRMTAAGMRDVPTGYSQDLLGNGNTVRNYGATVDEMQTKYEGFVRDNRLRETWGDDYQNLRLGKSQMTVLDFEKRVLDVQQQATNKYYEKGVDLIAKGDLQVKEGDYARTLGNYIDQQVRTELRFLAKGEGINDSMNSNIWAVNRSIRSDFVEGLGIPDNRLGSNLLADTTLARKSGQTDQLTKWNAIRPDANYLMVRPTQIGGSYVIPRTAIQPYNPVRSTGRGL